MVPVSLIMINVPGSKDPLRIRSRFYPVMWTELDLCIQFFITKTLKNIFFLIPVASLLLTSTLWPDWITFFCCSVTKYPKMQWLKLASIYLLMILSSIVQADLHWDGSFLFHMLLADIPLHLCLSWTIFLCPLHFLQNCALVSSILRGNEWKMNRLLGLGSGLKQCSSCYNLGQSKS